MAQAKQGDTVKVHYTGKLEDGRVFDTSSGREPLSFTIGEGTVIEGFESGIVGMGVGDKKTLNISPDSAYGNRNDELIAVVEKENIPEDIDVSVGQQLQVRQPDGQTINVSVTDVSEENVTLDANHPLAGRDLVFDVEIVEIA